MNQRQLLLLVLFFLWGLTVEIQAAEPNADNALQEIEIQEEQQVYLIEKNMMLCDAQDVPGLTFQPLDIPLSRELQWYTWQLAAEQGIEASVLFAIMEHESGYILDIVGYNSNGSTDVGLMQINSCNWAWLAQQGIDVHTPEGNIQAAVTILDIYLQSYPMEQALACYAAGEGGMRQGRGYVFAGYVVQRSQQIKQKTQGTAA